MGEVRNSAALVTTARVLAVGLVAVAVLRTAWVSDDALITLRSALNITHGWGPGFNATEAVQAYTHPLWFLLWVGIGVATNQWILGILAASVVFTATAVGILVLAHALRGQDHRGGRTAPAVERLHRVRDLRPGEPACLPAGGCAAGRHLRASTGHAVRAAAAAAALRRTRIGAACSSPRLLLTRTGPGGPDRARVVLLIIRDRRRRRPSVRSPLRRRGSSAAGAVVRHGRGPRTPRCFPTPSWPNGTSTSLESELVVQGLRYLWVTFEHDPVTLLGLLVGITVALATRSMTGRVWATGVLLYIGYLIWIGGDFMAGRFLAVPLYVAVFLLVAVVRRRR